MFPPRAIIDTNVVISGFLNPGNSREVLLLAAAQSFLAFSSPSLEQELLRILREKFKHTGKNLEREIETYRTIIYRFVYPEETLSVVKADSADNRVLEAAEEAKADFVITGDKHLLSLGSYKAIKIVTPANFLPFF